MFNLPNSELKLRGNGEMQEVFDPLRRKWVAFTPEEHVRAAFVQYLIVALGYPAGKLGNEIMLEHNGMRRRCDTVVYDNRGRALAIVEYKAPDVPIGPRVFEQILRYSLVLENRWIIVSNGMKHYCAMLTGNPSEPLLFVDHIPGYDELLTAH